MLAFFTANAASLCVGAAVAAISALIIRSMYRDHKAGKHACGGNCAGCSACSGCHGQNQ